MGDAATPAPVPYGGDLPFLCATYAASMNFSLPREDVERVVAAACDRAREKHSDFDRFLLGVNFLSTVIFCNHARVPIDVFVETLYCAVKHGDYSRVWRQMLKRPETDAVN